MPIANVTHPEHAGAAHAAAAHPAWSSAGWRAALLAVAWLWVAGPAGAMQWQLEPAGSRLAFVADGEGQPVPGSFRQFDAAIAFDPKRPDQARFEVRVDMTSATADSVDVADALVTPVWFDAASFPVARFRSWQVRPAAAGYVLTGELTLKGVRRPVTLQFDWEPTVDGAILTGAGRLDRREFGVGAGEWAEDPSIGFAVQVEFRLVLRPVPDP